MSPNEILAFMDQYGLIFLFAVVFLEYLNLPGFPAGVIYPAVGLWLSTTEFPFVLALGVSVAAGMLGSACVYGFGRLGGPPLLAKIRKKSPRSGEKIDKYSAKLLRHSRLTIILAKQIPLVRTVIDLPAGALRIRLRDYLPCAGLGVLLFNGVYLLVGVFSGRVIFAG